jgi:Raf kinase inhibitor-like YbhB/YbcL family protein
MNKRLLFYCGLVSFLGAVPALALQISSPAFADGQPIPAKYARGHTNLSPVLRIKGVPDRAKSLALIVDDPDAPSALFTHWLAWNISPQHALFLEGRPPRGAVVGKNSLGHVKYDGPFPPSGTHRYVFHLYALDSSLKLPEGSDRPTLDAAMKGHILTEADLTGTYSAGH